MGYNDRVAKRLRNSALCNGEASELLDSASDREAYLAASEMAFKSWKVYADYCFAGGEYARAAEGYKQLDWEEKEMKCRKLHAEGLKGKLEKVSGLKEKASLCRLVAEAFKEAGLKAESQGYLKQAGKVYFKLKKLDVAKECYVAADAPLSELEEEALKKADLLECKKAIMSLEEAKEYGELLSFAKVPFGEEFLWRLSLYDMGVHCCAYCDSGSMKRLRQSEVFFREQGFKKLALDFQEKIRGVPARWMQH
ncbi:MAG: hypothetical protein ABIB71_06790 [Candidatus Woesearchaeota archaeon]